MSESSVDLAKIRKVNEFLFASNLEGLRKLFHDHPEMVHFRDNESASWLSTAASSSTLEVVKFLVDAGLDVNFSATYFTPIRSAVSKGNCEHAKYLIEQGASLNVDRILLSAINADSCALELVKLLVENGVDVDQCWRAGEQDDETAPWFNALSHAIDFRKQDVAEYLHAHGAVMPPSIKLPPPSGLSDEVVAFFSRYGKVDPQALVEIIPTTDPPIAIHLMRPAKQRKYITLFTTGLSSRPMTVPPGSEAYKLAELAMFLPSDWPIERADLDKPQNRWPFEVLRKIAGYPHVENSWLGFPVTIFANEEPPKQFAPGCPFSATLLALDIDDVGPIYANAGQQIHIYTLMPLYAEERQLEMTKDLPALFRAFDKHKVSKVVNLSRRNVAKA